MSSVCILVIVVCLATVLPLSGQQAALAAEIQQRISLAEKARQTNDTERELSELQPAFERAIEIQSADYIQYILRSLVRAYGDIDQKQKAVDPIKRAVEAMRRIAGPESVEAAEFEAQAAMIYLDLDQHAEALKLMAEAERKIRKAVGPDSALLKEILEARAMMIAMTGDGKQGAGIMKEAEAIEQRRRRADEFGYVLDLAIERLVAQARSASAQKDCETADRLAAEITVAAERLDIQNPFRARAWYAAAMVYGSVPAADRGAVREKYLRRSLDLSETAMGNQRISDVMRPSLPLVHLQVFEDVTRTLSGYYATAGRSTDNLALLKRCVATFEQMLGPNHPMLGVWFGELSEFHLKQHSFAAAIDYQQRKLRTCELSFGPSDTEVEEPVLKLAEIYRAKGDEATARTFYHRATKLMKPVSSARTEEEWLRSDVRRLRLLFYFNKADEQVELFRARHPGSKVE
jgi:tetratricopeptide (TPR) repeat protein